MLNCFSFPSGNRAVINTLNDVITQCSDNPKDPSVPQFVAVNLLL